MPLRPSSDLQQDLICVAYFLSCSTGLVPAVLHTSMQHALPGQTTSCRQSPPDVLALPCRPKPAVGGAFQALSPAQAATSPLVLSATMEA